MVRLVRPILALSGLLLVSCATQPVGQPVGQSIDPPIELPTAGPLVASQAEAGAVSLMTLAGGPTPIAQPTVDPMAASAVVTIWWPSALYSEDSQALSTLREQIAEFQAQGHSTVIIRVKKADGLGGIVQTLLSGASVAPAAMPDLALLRVADLPKLAGAQLIRPLALPFDDPFVAAEALGQYENALYGVPYLLEMQHLAYRVRSVANPPRALDDLSALGQPYLFPAKGANGPSATLLAQYTAAGGRTADESGQPALDRGPLLRVLQAYDRAADAGVISPSVLEYGAPLSYWSQFMTGKVNIAQIDSTSFLAELAGGMPLDGPSAVAVGALPLPADAEPFSLVDGWLWVVTANNPARRDNAEAVIAWLTEADRLGAFSQALGMLPARRAALQVWQDGAYADFAAFAAPLLDRPAAPRPDRLDSGIAAALQEAFEAVLQGRLGAEAATDAAISRSAQRP